MPHSAELLAAATPSSLRLRRDIRARLGSLAAGAEERSPSLTARASPDRGIGEALPERRAARSAPVPTAYAEAMKAVAGQYPDDADIQVLAAEAAMTSNAWKLWSLDGKPAPGTEAVVAILELNRSSWAI